MQTLTAFVAAVLLVAVAACASHPPAEKPWDKEGVRHRAGETGDKLGKEEKR